MYLCAQITLQGTADLHQWSWFCPNSNPNHESIIHVDGDLAGPTVDYDIPSWRSLICLVDLSYHVCYLVFVVYLGRLLPSLVSRTEFLVSKLHFRWFKVSLFARVMYHVSETSQHKIATKKEGPTMIHVME